MRWNLKFDCSARAVAFVSCLLMMSCSFQPGRYVEGDPSVTCLELNCVVGEIVTRSSVVASEDEVKDINVFAYKDGRLFSASYERSSSTRLNLNKDCSYKVYAIVNSGKVTPPNAESDLSSLRIGDIGLEQMSSGGIPMATVSPVDVYASSQTMTVTLPLTRLAARYDLVLEKHLEKCDFTVTSVRIRQAASDCSPFAVNSAATTVTDGDRSSAADVVALNSGSAITFYMLENCQGILLPGNLDPWQKIPNNIPAKQGLCTFIEVSGIWMTSGAQANLEYRMYLGKDDVSDFNISRNTSGTLVLSLSDQGTIAASWKVQMSSLQDDRLLAFGDETVTLLQGGPSVNTSIIAYPVDIRYEVFGDQDELAEAGISWNLSGNQLVISSSYVGAEGKSARLYLSSWDRKVQDELLVNVAYSPGLFTEYSHKPALYSQQFGCITFPNATSSDPVNVMVAGQSQAVGAAVAGGIRYVFDSSSQIMFYFLSNDNRVYYRQMGYDSAVSSTVHLSHSTDIADLTISSASLPQYLVEPLNLNEYGTDFSYSVMLDDGMGSPLSFESFKVPDAIASRQGMSESERWEDFLVNYWDAVNFYWNDFSTELGNVPYLGFRVDAAMTSELIEDDVLAEMTFWGLRANGDKPASGEWLISNESYDEGLMCTKIPVRVMPSFPDQRYIGSFMNWQIAPGSLRRNQTRLDFGVGKVPDTHATWTFSDGYFSNTDVPSPSLAMTSSYDDRHVGMSISGTTLQFEPPTPVRKPVSGGFLLSGSLVNQHSGRVVTGYYTFDIVLYMSIGAQVDFEGNQISYSFVPFCEYSTREYADMWNDSFPTDLTVWSRNNLEASSSYENWFLTRITVPSNPTENTCRFTLGSYFIPGNTTLNCRYIYYNGLSALFRDIKFFFSLVHQNRIDYSRSGLMSSAFSYDQERVRGRRGYYELHLQQDVANMPEVSEHYGLDNLLVEAAYGSFDLY